MSRSRSQERRRTGRFFDDDDSLDIPGSRHVYPALASSSSVHDADIACLIQAESAKHNLPKNIVDQLSASAQSVAKDLHKQLRTKERIEVLAKLSADLESTYDVDMVADSAIRFRYPTGVPPFRAPPEAEWDETYSKCFEHHFQHIVVIPKDSTRLQALERVYHRMMCLKKELELEATRALSSMLKTLTSEASLTELIKKTMDDWMQTFDKLDIAPPPGIERRRLNSHRVFNDIYLNLVDRVVGEHNQRQREHDKTAERKSKLLNELAQRSPEEHLKNAIQMHSRGKGMGDKSNHADIDHVKLAAGHGPDQAVVFREAQLAASGQNQKSKSKGKNSGKTLGGKAGDHPAKGDGQKPKGGKHGRGRGGGKGRPQ